MDDRPNRARAMEILANLGESPSLGTSLAEPLAEGLGAELLGEC
jgi:hypothetical protein